MKTHEKRAGAAALAIAMLAVPACGLEAAGPTQRELAIAEICNESAKIVRTMDAVGAEADFAGSIERIIQLNRATAEPDEFHYVVWTLADIWTGHDDPDSHPVMSDGGDVELVTTLQGLAYACNTQ